MIRRTSTKDCRKMKVEHNLVPGDVRRAEEEKYEMVTQGSRTSDETF